MGTRFVIKFENVPQPLGNVKSMFQGESFGHLVSKGTHGKWTQAPVKGGCLQLASLTSKSMRSILGSCYHGDPHRRDVIDSKANGTISLSHVTTKIENKSQQLKTSEAIAFYSGFPLVPVMSSVPPTTPLTQKKFKNFFWCYFNKILKSSMFISGFLSLFKEISVSVWQPQDSVYA